MLHVTVKKKLLACQCFCLFVSTLSLIYTMRSVHFVLNLLHFVSPVLYQYFVRCQPQLIAKSYYVCTN